MALKPVRVGAIGLVTIIGSVAFGTSAALAVEQSNAWAVTMPSGTTSVWIDVQGTSVSTDGDVVVSWGPTADSAEPVALRRSPLGVGAVLEAAPGTAVLTVSTADTAKVSVTVADGDATILAASTVVTSQTPENPSPRPSDPGTSAPTSTPDPGAVPSGVPSPAVTPVPAALETSTPAPRTEAGRMASTGIDGPLLTVVAIAGALIAALGAVISVRTRAKRSIR